MTKVQIAERLEKLRDLINDEDIPSPTIPEYIEHHASIRKIVKALDNILLEILT